MNPWIEINLNDYENHMKLQSVYQLQTMNKLMFNQLNEYKATTVMILGVAGGNGLNHVDKKKIKVLYGVDINNDYLNECKRRYDFLGDILTLIHTDLLSEECVLPKSDLVIANLLVEYIGYDIFVKRIKQINPNYVSVVIQINDNYNFVSDSPYVQAFQRLNEVHHQVSEIEMTNSMNSIEYDLILHKDEKLPNGKRLVRLDYEKASKLK